MSEGRLERPAVLPSRLCVLPSGSLLRYLAAPLVSALLCVRLFCAASLASGFRIRLCTCFVLMYIFYYVVVNLSSVFACFCDEF